MPYLRLLGALLCVLPTLLFAQLETGPNQFDPSIFDFDAQYPCTFDWGSIELTDGSTVNYLEDKECQPFQGPCIAFSFVKVMEANLNITTGNACRNTDLSIPWLDYKAYYRGRYLELLSSGGGVPIGECGMFPRTNAQNAGQRAGECIRSQVVDVAINDDRCFTIEWNEEVQSDPDASCEDIWTVSEGAVISQWAYANTAVTVRPTTIDALKKYLIESPLVAIIDSNVLYDYRNYPHDNTLQFHSFVITGWEDQTAGEIIWKVDDHWPNSDAGFCGQGNTNPISSSTLLADIAARRVTLIRIAGVSTSTGCMGERDEFTLTDQNDCEAQEENCLQRGLPIITDLFTTSSPRCLTSGTMNRVQVAIDCQNNNSSTLELEWRASPGGVTSPAVIGCGGQAFVIPNNQVEVFVSVRARFGPDCPWTEWYVEDFCVERSGGGSEGPKLWGW